MTKAPGISWEKTVEWDFICKFLDKFEIAAPLDGLIELSDALFAGKVAWSLIEFKHRQADTESEAQKYPFQSYKRARTVIRRHYSKEDLESFPAHSSKTIAEDEFDDWFKKALKAEVVLAGGDTHEAESKVLHRAAAAFKELFEKYCLPAMYAPHYFIFHDEKNRHRAMRYWEYNGVPHKTFTPQQVLLDVTDPFENFADYCERVATARGYLPEEIWDDGGGGGTLLFGRVIGLNRAHVLPLRSLLQWLPELKKAMQKANKQSTPT